MQNCVSYSQSLAAVVHAIIGEPNILFAWISITHKNVIVKKGIIHNILEQWPFVYYTNCYTFHIATSRKNLPNKCKGT